MLDAVVVGAGHAGLAMSWHLRKRGIDHVVLEQGDVGETWRTQRWDSFATNTPWWANLLPGDQAADGPADGFPLRDTWVAWLSRYAAANQLPTRTHTRVTSLEPAPDGSFRLLTDGAADPIAARTVVAASGFQRVPRLPAIAGSLPPSVVSLHTADYRRPEQLPPGAVLVVGGAQSGGQIVEDLLDAGRRVFHAVSPVGRIPRRYRGRDIFECLIPVGFFDQTIAQLPDPRMQFAPQPLVSGTGRYGHTLSLQYLAARGAVLVGHLRGIDGSRVHFDQDVAASVRHGDRISGEIGEAVDRNIAESGTDRPAAQADPADQAVADPDRFVSPDHLDLDREGIRTVVWATGFGGDLSWIRLPVTNPAGTAINEQGRSPVPGLWFLGIPWMRTRKSGIIMGAGEDGSHTADQIAAYLTGTG